MPSAEKKWIGPTILLCVNGLFPSINPSEPYITPYLMGPRKNLTESELVNQVYPVWIYSYFCFLVPVFLLTDILKYKPIIIIEGLSHIACWLLLIFGEGVFQIQIMQVLYGMATAFEIGYYSYIYSIVPEEKYQQVTSYTRSVVLFGLFIGAVLAQLLVSFAKVDYFYLNIISLINISIGFIISLFLPMPKRSLYFHSAAKCELKRLKSGSEHHLDGETATEENKKLVADRQINEEISTEEAEFEKSDEKESYGKVMLHLLTDLKNMYFDRMLLRWSLWWALSTCGYMLVTSYIQNLWETIHPSINEEQEVYNGAVEALAQLLGAVGAFVAGYIQLNWTIWGELVLGFCSILKCGVLVMMFLTTEIWICYSAYIIFNFLFEFVITIAQFQLAVGLNTQRFALVFGANTFVAIGINMILTAVFIDEAGFGFDVQTQFMIFSAYFGLLAIIFLSQGLYTVMKFGCPPVVPDASEIKNEDKNEKPVEEGGKY